MAHRFWHVYLSVHDQKLSIQDLDLFEIHPKLPHNGHNRFQPFGCPHVSQLIGIQGIAVLHQQQEYFFV
jgi:hypothetical protein